MNVLLSDVDHFIKEHALFTEEEVVVVAVSGGLDSVVLLDLLHRRGQPLIVAHVHHGLRGEDADADAAFVRKLAEERGVPFVLRRVDVLEAMPEGASLEEVARTVRYRQLHEVARVSGSRVVAAAHHRDDQAETVLLNLFRGAGLEGLAGMAPYRELQAESPIRLVRPLLEIGRGELEDYVRARSLEWREDATNEDVSLRRNALRHDILPRVRSHFGSSAAAKVSQAAGLVRAYLDETWGDELQRRFAQCQRVEDEPVLDAEALARQPAVWQGRLVLEALERWLPTAPRRRGVAAEVVGLLKAQPGRRVELGQGVVWRERGVLRFVAVHAPPPDENRRLRAGGAVDVAGWRIEARVSGALPADVTVGAPERVYLDADRLQWPLVVRPWRAGDRVRPLGMAGTRLVSDVLTEARVRPSERERQLVILSGESVCWVVGHRVGHPFRVTEATEQVVSLHCEQTA